MRIIVLAFLNDDAYSFEWALLIMFKIFVLIELPDSLVLDGNLTFNQHINNRNYI